LNEYSLLDLTAEDADVLVDLAGTATSINEIESAAAAVSRLWLRGRQFTTEMFASLVLRGEAGAET